MDSVRLSLRIAQGLPALQVEAFTRQRVMPVAIDTSSERENKENVPPILLFPNSVERVNVLRCRTVPRLPLQDISHLFPSNGRSQSNENATSNAVVTDRGLRRSTESSLSLRKRKVSESESTTLNVRARPESKCKRPSTGIRSFR
ncbi:hypothetical protein R1sor_019522 [Riccia sorocarpa]|uniref:Uncharacterized protein n=1 Tax=Riccia sorocarpa TaxID=122646 RepID=A0ABD3IGD9_9MARC